MSNLTELLDNLEKTSNDLLQDLLILPDITKNKIVNRLQDGIPFIDVLLTYVPRSHTFVNHPKTFGCTVSQQEFHLYISKFTHMCMFLKQSILNEVTVISNVGCYMKK